jgi:hypothetical protein
MTKVTRPDLDTALPHVIDGYKASIYWTEENPDEGFTKDSQFADQTLLNIEGSCKKTLLYCFEVFPEDYHFDKHNLYAIGKDLWLTRNGHGSGFWDGDWPEVIGEKLTAYCHAIGQREAYLGDDGLIYFVGFES